MRISTIMLRLVYVLSIGYIFQPPWINDHWPIIVGCLGAAVIITVVVVIGYMRDK